MRKIAAKTLIVAVILFFSGIASTLKAQSMGDQIIADHTVVEWFDQIPQEYMNVVKEMWLVVAGESHAEAYRSGLEALEGLNPAFAVNITESGTPEAYTNAHLRSSTGTWGDLEHASGWIYDYGREDWFTSRQAIDRTKAGITYCNTNNLAIAAMGYGWCYDPTIYDPTQYLNATAEYIEHCAANNYPTQVFYSTGPVDGDSYTNRGAGGAYGYNIFQRNQRIRAHVTATPSAILFDYADILTHDANGEQSTLSWNGRAYEVITPTNLGNGRTGHIGPEGALRLAKAMWWMLARMAGWDGVFVENPVTSIEVSTREGGPSIDTPNGTLQLQAEVFPENASIKSVNWFVDDPEMASINSSGELTKKKKNGTVTAIAIAKDGTGITGTLDILLSNQDFSTSVPTQKLETKIFCHNRIIHISSEEWEGQPCTLKIFDLNGRMLEQEQINPTSFTYDAGHLNNGIYIIHLSRQNWNSLFKISIM